MKKCMLAQVLVVILSGCCRLSSAPEAPPAPPEVQVPCPPGSPEPIIIIDEAKVTYNGQPLPVPGTLEQWEGLLGKEWVSAPDDAWLSWPKLGIAALRTPEDEKCLYLLAVMLSDFDPRVPTGRFDGAPEYWSPKPFAGCLALDGVRLHPDMGWKDINAQKKGKQFWSPPPTYSERAWERRTGKVLGQRPPYYYIIKNTPTVLSLATCGTRQPADFGFYIDYGLNRGRLRSLKVIADRSTGAAWDAGIDK